MAKSLQAPVRPRVPVSARKRLRGGFLFFLATAALAGGAWATTDGGVARLTETLRTELPADGPAVTILATRHGETIFQWASGLADRDASRAATLGTPFRIGSVSKQFVAAAILRLADQGRLSVDDPLTKFFPGYPGGENLPLRLLLTHRSGLANFTAKPDFMNRVTQPIAPAELIAWFRDDPPDFPPDARCAYSNTNYFLLGEIVAKVSGQSLDDFLREQFFTPLGLKSTGVFRNSDPPAGSARGYSYREEKLVPATDWDMSWAGGAGALFSTAGDLCLWTEALHGGRVLSPASLRAMRTFPESSDDASGTDRYGFGLYRSEIGGLPVIEHNGGLDGFLSRLAWFPEQKLAIAVLGNAMPPPPRAAPAQIMSRVARAVLEDEISQNAPKLDPAVNPATFREFAGRYDYHTAVMDITVENDRIFARLTGQKRFEIFPSGPDAFFFKVAEAQLAFVRDAEGKVVAVRHTQNDSTFRAARVEEKAVLSEAELESLTGKYQYGLLAVMTVTRDGSQLFAQLGDQPKFPIFAESKVKFAWHVVRAEVVFQRDEKGAVLGATHTQNGSSFFAPKIDHE